MQETGIRMALGARARDVLVGVLCNALLLIAIGLILGLAGSFPLTRIIKSVLWGVTATEPAALTGVLTLLAAVTVISALIPALRAAKLEPNTVLRYE
jgi:ABC-type antimicrobial peptide transport system permease subunit